TPPTPVKIRKGEANDDAKLIGAIAACFFTKRDDILTSYPNKMGQQMTVKQGKKYMEDAVKRFFEAGLVAERKGID
ncbi:hypothetical protein RJ641_033962, partial [Dillenia turbinata]